MMNEQFEKEMLRKYPYENIVGSSPSMKEVFKMIEKAAPSEICVTITGETGTGKELVARAIHHRSGRSGNPFIEVHASALPETLLEAELFGHEKGAFTDAHKRKIGYFESCENGSIFLDEIGEISHKVQVSLLRVLQEKKITRLGSTKPINVNVRIITATNKNLEKLVEKGLLREDFYYRIKAFVIHLPPLRERREDVKPLVEHFIKKYTNKAVTVSDEAMEQLLQYDYPGNVRELEQSIIQRALTLQENNIIHSCDLPTELMGRGKSTELTGLFNLAWKDAKTMMEKMYIENVLGKTGGNVTKASEISGIDRSYLQKQIKKLGIKR
jgi:transcriptional regulator with PAS, ATPase and Fis domain